MKKNTFITAKEIANILDVSEYQAYRILHSLNKELSDEGFFTLPNKAYRKHFMERMYSIENGGSVR